MRGVCHGHRSNLSNASSAVTPDRAESIFARSKCLFMTPGRCAGPPNLSANIRLLSAVVLATAHPSIRNSVASRLGSFSMTTIPARLANRRSWSSQRRSVSTMTPYASCAPTLFSSSASFSACRPPKPRAFFIVRAMPQNRGRYRSRMCTVSWQSPAPSPTKAIV